MSDPTAALLRHMVRVCDALLEAKQQEAEQTVTSTAWGDDPNAALWRARAEVTVANAKAMRDQLTALATAAGVAS